MAKLSEVFPSAYLKADEIPEEGMVLTISEVEIKELGQGSDKQVKPVITFEEVEKQLVCNKTNAGTIVKLTGSDDTDDWAGHKVRLIAMEVQGPHGLVNSIRISSKPVKAAPKKAAPAPVAEADNDSDIPF
jgi:hypothetical protein